MNPEKRHIDRKKLKAMSIITAPLLVGLGIAVAQPAAAESNRRVCGESFRVNGEDQKTEAAILWAKVSKGDNEACDAVMQKIKDGGVAMLNQQYPEKVSWQSYAEEGENGWVFNMDTCEHLQVWLGTTSDPCTTKAVTPDGEHVNLNVEKISTTQ
jgi:hypothetical protein